MNTELYTGKDSALAHGFLVDGTTDGIGYYMTGEQSIKTVNYVNGHLSAELIIKAPTFRIDKLSGQHYLTFIANALTKQFFSGHVATLESSEILNNSAIGNYLINDNKINIHLSKDNSESLDTNVAIKFTIMNVSDKLSSEDIDNLYRKLIEFEAHIKEKLLNVWRPPPPRRSGGRRTVRRVKKHSLKTKHRKVKA